MQYFFINYYLDKIFMVYLGFELICFLKNNIKIFELYKGLVYRNKQFYVFYEVFLYM